MREKTRQSFERANTYTSAYPTLMMEHQGQRFLLEQGYASLDELHQRISAILN